MSVGEPSSSQPGPPPSDQEQEGNGVLSDTSSKEDTPLIKLVIPGQIREDETHFRLRYIAEGAANLLYEFVPVSSDNGLPDKSYEEPPWTVSTATGKQRFDNRLLRIGKQIPSYQTGTANFNFFQETITPLFNPSNLVQMESVRLDSRLISHLNNELSLLDEANLRPPWRHGTRINPHETHAILVENMSASPTASPPSYSFEFKPKWLTPSPDAGPGATRCRTCALLAHRKAKGAASTSAPKPTMAAPVCPLGLLAGAPDYVRRTVAHLLQSKAFPYGVADAEWGPVERDLTQFFLPGGAGNELLQTLAAAQRRFCTESMLAEGGDGDERDERLRRLMVLRDCSLFIRYTKTESEGAARIEAKLADFDKKGIDKAEGWRDKEKKLRDKGFYRASELQDPFDHVCFLAELLRSSLPRSM